MITSRTIRAAALLAVVLISGPIATQRLPAAQATTAQGTRSAALPARLTDAEFWRLVSDVSEPGGYFRITDNYTSNEGEIGKLSTMLRETGVKGGVYMGVGPEQNFSYIAAIRPDMAFVVDIRRQAVMQHLMFKAIFEMAPDRADFIATLFSKPRPTGLDSSTSIQKIWEAFAPVATDDPMGRGTYGRVTDSSSRPTVFPSPPRKRHRSGGVRRVPDVWTVDYDARRRRRRRQHADVRRPDWKGDRRRRSGAEFSLDRGQLPIRQMSAGQEPDRAGQRRLSAARRRFARSGRTCASATRPSARSTSRTWSSISSRTANRRRSSTTWPRCPRPTTTVFIRPYSLRGRGADPLCPIGPFVGGAFNAGRVFSNNDALACVR